MVGCGGNNGTGSGSRKEYEELYRLWQHLRFAFYFKYTEKPLKDCTQAAIVSVHFKACNREIDYFSLKISLRGMERWPSS